MAYKSDRQRKAMFARMNSKQLRKQGIILQPNKDTDKDGIINKNDCKPLDPNKQGKLHDLQLKILRKREEKLEAKQKEERAKLKDLQDELKERQKIASKTANIKRLRLKQKQAVIDELSREKKKLDQIKKANQSAKRQLDKLTITGKTKTLAKKTGVAALKGGKKAGIKAAKASKTALIATQAFLQKKSTKRTLKKIKKALIG